MKRILLLLVTLGCACGAFAQTPKTVRAFLKMSNKDTTLCQLHGVVDRIRNKDNGNLYLTDGTGEVLIYGVRDGSGQGLKFPDLDVRQGDTLTLVGRRSVYDGKVVEMQHAVLVAKSDGPDHANAGYSKAKVITEPTFKGKDKLAFSKWVTEHLVYPKEAGGIEGTVKVKFVVGRDGHVQEVEVVKGIHPLLNEEAVRVIRKSPKWKPAKADGVPVRYTYVLPVIFSYPR
ncbi:MAG: energy transducer TonB [Bacteroidales bacterium]|nr:energy transducer TonB [Bacteroidales bacterium]